jgi:hypothetical protein
MAAELPARRVWQAAKGHPLCMPPHRCGRANGVAYRCADLADEPRHRGMGASQRQTNHSKEYPMGLGTILLIVLILILVGVIPTWPHSRGWGYAPSGIVGLIVVVLLVLLLMGRL